MSFSFESTISAINSKLDDIASFYAEKFPEIVTVTSTTPGPNDSDGNPTDPASVEYNKTLIDLNTQANLITDLIGGVLRDTKIPSPDPDPVTTPGSTESPGQIVNPINSALSTWITNLQYDTGMMCGCRLFLTIDSIKTSSNAKILAIGSLNRSVFLGNILSSLEYVLNANYESLDPVYSAITNQINYCTNKISYMNQVIGSVNSVISFYTSKVRLIGSLSLYSGTADFVTHAFYTDSEAFSVLNKYDSATYSVFNNIENAIPGLVEDQSDSIKEAIAAIDNIREKLSGYNESYINNLLNEVEAQFLSNSVENYGNKIAAIITNVMRAIPPELENELIEDCLTIQTSLESTVLSSLNASTIINKALGSWGTENNLQDTHDSLVLDLSSKISLYVEN